MTRMETMKVAMKMERVKSSDVEGVTVDEDGRGVPLYGRTLRILLGGK